MIIIRDSSKIKKYCNMYKVFLKLYYAYVGVLTLLNPPNSELYPSLRQPPPSFTTIGQFISPFGGIGP